MDNTSLGSRTQITITLDDFDALRQQVKDAEERAAKTEAEARQTLINADSHVPYLINTIAASLPLVQFAVANCDPTVIRKWPHADLAHFGRLLHDLPVGLHVLPGTAQFTKELGLELQAEAAAIALVEKERAQGRHPETKDWETR